MEFRVDLFGRAIDAVDGQQFGIELTTEDARAGRAVRSKQPGDRYPAVKDFSDAFAAAAQTTAMGSASSSAPSAGNTTSPSAGATSASADTEDKGGLFGKMKGLFRRG